jgi:hypothetical protein
MINTGVEVEKMERKWEGGEEGRISLEEDCALFWTLLELSQIVSSRVAVVHAATHTDTDTGRQAA